VHVIATAGHVDHGKSTLVEALTGSDPDRLEEEHRRGLSIQLGYCWTSLPPVGDVAFVDVPGHERFVSTMLAGIGPVPAVLFVVAADDPWMPQAAEHLAALDAVGVTHGVLAVTRCDLADPAAALAQARSQLDRTSLAGSPAVAVSGRTGAGLEELRGLLVDMVRALPDPAETDDVRLWVDRCFHVVGAGTVVTGTLPAGRIAVGDTLALGSGESVRVRALQSLGRPVEAAVGVARVAVNVGGIGVEQLNRSSVLLTPGAWRSADVVDVRLTGVAAERRPAGRVPERPRLHVGATAVTVVLRSLDESHARLVLDRPLPLRIGDRAVLRDPGSRRIWGVTVLDPAPGSLGRRGAAKARAAELARHHDRPDVAAELHRRGVVRADLLRRIGVRLTDPPAGTVVAGGWMVDAVRATALREQMRRLVDEHARSSPLQSGIAPAALAHDLGLPDAELVVALVEEPLRVHEGRVCGPRSAVLPPAVERALAELERDLAEQPFRAPTADRLRELCLDAASLAAAAKAHRLLRLADGVVLLPGADELARSWLAELEQPFTTSAARVRLGTSRRVVLPLLAHLDSMGWTQRLEDDRRRVRPS
jgi:selenocysteine-specific elongation factor